MSRRNYIRITIVIFILLFDVVVYKYQGANCSNVILRRCYPTGEIFPFKDLNGNIKYDSVYPALRDVQ
jgi:hypothetical protein